MTKFEAGKKYYGGSCHKDAIEYLCTHVINGYGVAMRHKRDEPFFMHPGSFWEEVPPPLTFADLKVGEKFKWLVTKDCGSAACMKVKLISGKFGFFNTPKDIGWVVLDTGVIYDANLEDKVERVP